MAKNYQTGIIITGDGKGGIKAIEATGSALDKFQKKTKQSQIDVSELASKMGGLATAFGGATTAGAAFVAFQANAIKEQHNFAKALGMSSEALSGLQYAFKDAAVSGEKIGDILKDTSEKIGEAFATGGGEAAEALELLKLNAADLVALSPDQQLLKIADALDAVGTQSEKIAITEMLASDMSLLLPVLEQGAEGIRQAQIEAQVLGVALSNIDSSMIAQASADMGRLGGAFKGAGNILTAEFAPAMGAVSDLLVDTIVDAGGLSNKIEGLGEAALNGVGFVVENVRDAADAFEALSYKVGLVYAILNTEVSLSTFDDIGNLVDEYNAQIQALYANNESWKKSYRDGLQERLAGYQEEAQAATTLSTVMVPAIVTVTDSVEDLADQEKAWIEASKQYHAEYRAELEADWAAAETLRQNMQESQYNKDMSWFDAMDADDAAVDALKQSIEDIELSVDSIGDAWTRTGDAASEALANMSKTFQDFAKEYEAAGKDQQKIDDARFDNLDNYSKGLIDLSEFKENEIKLDAKQSELNQQNTSNMIGLYQGLAANIAGAFEQGSTAAKAFTAIQQGLALYDGIRAVINAWSAPYPMNLVQVPLTIANVGALLAQMGQTFSGGGGGGMSPSEALKQEAETTFAGLDAENTAVTNRLDQQIELLEAIERNGSATAIQVAQSQAVYEGELLNWVKDIYGDSRQGFVGSAFGEGDWERIQEDFSRGGVYNPFTMSGNNIAFDVSRAYQDPTQLVEFMQWVMSEREAGGRPYTGPILQGEDWTESGYQTTLAELEASFTELQGYLNDWAIGSIESLNELSDASDKFKESYDIITGTATYATQELNQAYADFNAVSGGDYAGYLQDNIVAIQEAENWLYQLSGTFDESGNALQNYQLLLSKSPELFQSQTDAVQTFNELLGDTFEGGAEEALNFIDSIDLVVESLSKTRDLEDRLLQLTDASAYLALIRERELSVLTEEQQALQLKIWALEDANNSLDDVTNGLDDVTNSLNEFSQSLVSLAIDTVNARNLALSSVGSNIEQIQAQIDSVSSEAVAEALDDSNILRDQLNVLQSLESSLENTRISLSSAILEQSGGSFSTGLAMLKQALAGDSNIDVQTALGYVSNNDASLYASREAYARAQAEAYQIVAALEQQAEAQIDPIQSQLDALDAVNELQATQIELDETNLDLLRDQLATLQSIEMGLLTGLSPSGAIVDTLRTEFALVDVNDDGRVTKDEFEQMFAGVADAETLGRLFAVADADGDGIISQLEALNLATFSAKDEWIAELTPIINEISTGQLTQDQVVFALQGLATEEQAVALFRMLDTDNDGILSKLELSNGLLADLSPNIAGILSGDITAIDQTLDGLIDWSEFHSAFVGLASDEELRNIFNELDVNGDGQISELERINSGVADLLTQAQVTSFTVDNFSDLDSSLDNVIDWQEFHSAFEGLATDQVLMDGFNALDANLDGLLTAMEVQAPTVASTINDIYQSVFGRDADSAGLQFYSDMFESGMLNTGDLIDTLISGGLASGELSGTAGAVNAAYNAIFGRDADASGLAFYTDLIDSGSKSLGDVITDLEWAKLNGSFAQGIERVPFDMNARIHEGEAVLPTPQADFLRLGGFSKAIDKFTAEIAKLRGDVQRLERNQSTHLGAISRHTKESNDYQQINLTYQQEIATNTGAA